MTRSSPLVLLLDDDVDFIAINRHILETAGYRVAECHDPGRALETMAAEKPDIVISDLMMEALDAGFSFARRVKEDERFKDVPIILATSVGSRRGFNFRPRTQEELAAMSVDAYLDKPVAAKTLLEKVGSLLRKRSPEA